MPNNTYTEVLIQGLEPEIKLIGNRLQILENDPGDRDGFLTSFLGDPAEGCSKLESPNDIRIEEWGSKWDVYNVRNVVYCEIPESQRNEFTYHGEVECIWDSAWSPPVRGLQELSKKHGLTIQIKYEDEGMFYVGMLKLINGKQVFDQHYEDVRVIEGLYQVFGIDRLREYFGYHFDNNHISAFTLLTSQKHWMPQDVMLDIMGTFLNKLEPKDIRPLIK